MGSMTKKELRKLILSLIEDMESVKNDWYIKHLARKANENNREFVEKVIESELENNELRIAEYQDLIINLQNEYKKY